MEYAWRPCSRGASLRATWIIVLIGNMSYTSSEIMSNSILTRACAQLLVHKQLRELKTHLIIWSSQSDPIRSDPIPSHLICPPSWSDSWSHLVCSALAWSDLAPSRDDAVLGSQPSWRWLRRRIAGSPARLVCRLRRTKLRYIYSERESGLPPLLRTIKQTATMVAQWRWHEWEDGS